MMEPWSALGISVSLSAVGKFFPLLADLSLTFPRRAVYSYLGVHFSLMSAPSELEPHPSCSRMTVRLSLVLSAEGLALNTKGLAPRIERLALSACDRVAWPVTSTASTLLVWSGAGRVLQGGRSLSLVVRGVTPG